jgi:hypothetical protein
MIDHSLSAEDLAMVLKDMRWKNEGHQHDEYPSVNVEVMIDGIMHLLEVNEYYFDTESNMIIITTDQHYT